MVISTMLAFQFLRAVWGYSLVVAAVLLLPLFIIEVLFLAANLLKIHDGGWVPVALALAIMIMMWTWTRGQAYLKRLRANNEIPLDSFIRSIERKSDHSPVTVPGTAVFLTSVPDRTPNVLLHNLKHNHVLHEQNVILTVWTEDEPYVPDSRRIKISQLAAFRAPRHHFRLHGRPRRHQGASSLPGKRLQVRDHEDVVLSRP